MEREKNAVLVSDFLFLSFFLALFYGRRRGLTVIHFWCCFFEAFCRVLAKEGLVQCSCLVVACFGPGSVSVGGGVDISAFI